MTIDPELAEQVEAVRDQVHAHGEAGMLRELALRGARATLAGKGIAARPSAQWVPVEAVATALAGVPATPDLMDDLGSLTGDLTDPFE